MARQCNSRQCTVAEGDRMRRASPGRRLEAESGCGVAVDALDHRSSRRRTSGSRTEEDSMKPVAKLVSRVRCALSPDAEPEVQRLLLGKLLAERTCAIAHPISFADVEFSVFSQFGDDGIIQWLVKRLALRNEVFVEFGVADYQEANTRFLLINNNWSGLVLDGSAENIESIRRDKISWRHDLRSACVFITAENINQAIAASGIHGAIGLLHIDLDGNDYWVWKSVSVVRPDLVILEYNSVFGVERAITVPYDPGFVRTRAHFSNLYQGASLLALCDLSAEKGYDFVGSNSAGNNAYFVRRDLQHGLRVLSPEKGFVVSKFAESRNEKGDLSFVRGAERLHVIRSLPVTNTRTGLEECI